jgi:hypothetical protein
MLSPHILSCAPLPVWLPSLLQAAESLGANTTALAACLNKKEGQRDLVLMQLQFLAPPQHGELAELMPIAGTSKAFGMREGGIGGMHSIYVESSALSQLPEGSEQLHCYRRNMEQLIRGFSGFAALAMPRAAAALDATCAARQADGQLVPPPSATPEPSQSFLQASFTLPMAAGFWGTAVPPQKSAWIRWDCAPLAEAKK